MKKAGGVILLLGLSFLMGGCLQDLPLTDQELDVVAEYAADLLLKYDVNYTSPLLRPEEMGLPTQIPTPTQAAAVTPTSTPVPSGSDGQLPIVSDNMEFINEKLTEVIGIEGAKVAYREQPLEEQLHEEIRENKYWFSLEPKDGIQYLQIQFDVTNTTDGELDFRTLEQKLSCAVYVNVSTVARACLTLWENDLQYMDTKIAPGETVQATLAFEISSKTAIDSLHVTITNRAGDAVIIKLR